MTSRDLPNVYTTLNDMSALIEGNDSLTVGITVKANRGPVGQALQVTDSSDFLTRYTFTGKPGVKQDSGYFDVIELLKVSSNVFVSRAANNPLYGGLIVKKEIEVGDFTGVAEFNEKRIIVDGDVTNKLTENGFIRIKVGKNSYRYAVKEFKYVGDKTDILLTEKVDTAILDALKEDKQAAYDAAYAQVLAASNNDVETAKDAVAEAEAKIAAETSNKEVAEETKVTAQKAKTDAEAKKTEATQAKTAAESKKQQAETEKASAEEALRKAESEENEENKRTAQATIDDKEAEIKEAQATIDAKEAEIKEAEATITSAESAITEADKAIEAAGTAITEAETAKEKAEKTLETANTALEVKADEAGKEAEVKVGYKFYNCVEPVKLNDIFLTDRVKTVDPTANEDKGYKGAFILDDADDEGKKAGSLQAYFNVGDRIRLENCKTATGVVGAEEATQYYTVVSTEYNQKTLETKVFVKEKVDGTYTPAGEEYAGVKIYREAIADPETYIFKEDDLFLVTGIDQGAYNANIGLAIDSGEEVELDEAAGAFKLYVHNLLTGVDLEEFLVALNPLTKSIDGTNLEIAGIVNAEGNGSEYIKVYVNPDLVFEDEYGQQIAITPSSTPQRELNVWCALGGGYDGDEVEVSDCINALEVFANKSVPVSLLVNGNNENILYQLALLGICESRKDCFAFLRTFRSYEKIALPTQRVKQLVNYKKNTLGSTEYLAAMYGPHVTTYDNFNSRNVVIGADSVACRKWLQVIHDYGYPRAAAGIDDGRLNNISLEWKIGDESSEAVSFNDASMNMIVWDAKRKLYYFNTQNTLQLANSAFRNVGAVLNVLDIKEYLTFNLKSYVQKPIDGDGQLQEACIRTIEQYMDICKSGGRVSDYVIQDVTTRKHISDNELHFVLTLAPAYYAQKIYLAINVVNAAFDFQILQSM